MIFSTGQTILGKIVPVLLAVSLTNSTAYAEISIEPKPSSSNKVESKLRSVLDAPGITPNHCIRISYLENGQGVVCQPTVTQSNADPHTNFDCLEALCGISPTFGLSMNRCSMLGRSANFEKMNNPGKSSKSAIKLGAGDYSMYLIPRGLVFLYPQLFTPEELSSVNNLRIIKATSDSDDECFTNAKLKLWNVSEAWSDFLLKTKNPSRAAVSQFAEAVEQKYMLVKSKS